MGIDTTVIPSQINVDNVTIEKTGDIINVKNLGIDTAQLKDLAVSTTKIANGAVTSSKLSAPVPVLVSTQTLATTASYVEWTGLDINTDGAYKIIFSASNGHASLTRNCAIYLSGDTTDSNYNSIRCITTTSANTREYDSGSPNFTGSLTANTNFSGEITVTQTINTRPLIFAVVATEDTVQTTRVRKTNVTSNVTAIRLYFQGSVFGAGSIFQLYKIPK